MTGVRSRYDATNSRSDMAQPEAVQSEERQTRLPIDAIQKTIDVLVIERQRLHDVRASRHVLEANRRAIGYWQRELGLARQHLRPM
jgi:hypothetical protein